MNIPATLKMRATLLVVLTAAGLFFGGFAHGYGLDFGTCLKECEGE
jgi:hypothetical protein